VQVTLESPRFGRWPCVTEMASRVTDEDPERVQLGEAQSEALLLSELEPGDEARASRLERSDRGTRGGGLRMGASLERV